MSDKQQKALEAYNDALRYGIDCMEAIDSIGGDPATVGELVAALRNLHALVLSEAPRILEDDHHAEMARAVLAKLPENSND